MRGSKYQPSYLSKCITFWDPGVLPSNCFYSYLHPLSLKNTTQSRPKVRKGEPLTKEQREELSQLSHPEVQLGKGAPLFRCSQSSADLPLEYLLTVYLRADWP